MTYWSSMNLRCDCCTAIVQTKARAVAGARELARHLGWGLDRSGKKDWCPDCVEFKCMGRH